MTIPSDLALRYCPRVVFHPNEEFFPCSIEFLLTNAALYDPNVSAPIRNPTQQDLAAHAAANCYVDIAESQYPGQGTNAPMYYAVQEYGDLVRIHYIMLYAYQGGQTARALNPVGEFDFIVNTYGTHQGDVEHVAVTLQKMPDGTFRPTSVQFDAHGDARVYPTQRVDWVDTHPIVHPALTGHSSRNTRVEGSRISEDRTPYVVDILSVAGEGQVWAPTDLRLLGLDSQNNPIGTQMWAAFAGRLGKPATNGLSSATYFNGDGLSTLDWGFVKTVAFAADKLHKLDKYKDGDGVGAPGSHGDWLYPANAPLIGSGMQVEQAVEPTGGTPTWLAWRSGSFDGTTTQLAQIWNLEGLLFFTTWGNDPEGRLGSLGGGATGTASDAFAFLVADILGDEQKEIVQLWDNGQINATVFTANDQGGFTVAATSNGLGPNSQASWLAGDFLGQGHDQLVQINDVDGGTNLTLFMADPNGVLSRQGTTAPNNAVTANTLGWFVGAFGDTEPAQLVQVRDDNGAVSLLRFGKSGQNGLDILSISNPPNCSTQGTLAWLVGDFHGDGKTEIVQAVDNNGAVMFFMYGDDGGQGMRLIGSITLPRGPATLAWLVGDFQGTGMAQIAQLWDSDGTVAVYTYGYVASAPLPLALTSALTTQEKTPFPNSTINWSVGDFDGDGRDEILLLWSVFILGRWGLVEFGMPGPASSQPQADVASPVIERG